MLKKVVYIFIASLLVFTLTGCGSSTSKEEKILNCTATMNNVADGYNLNTEYKVTYIGDVVKRIELVESATSNDPEVIDYLETYLNTYYTNLNNAYGGYTWNIEKSYNKLVSNTVMDYTKINLNKYVTDLPNMKYYLNDNNELTIQGVKTMYSSIGATCED